MSATTAAPATTSTQRVTLRERLANPWGRPRFLALTTWLYILWSLVPVLLAVRFAFNSGRSRTSLQGWSLRWFWQDPTLSVFHDPTLQAALKHSLVLAALVMVIATPLGTALALGMRRWTGPSAGAANIVLLLPLVTPELVFAVGMFLLFTPAFGFIGLGTTAQAIGQVTFTLSWVVLIVRGRLATIGREVEEAAGGLGAPRGARWGRRRPPPAPRPCTWSGGCSCRCCCRRWRPACSCPSRCRSTTSWSASTWPRARTPRPSRCGSTRRPAAARRPRSTRWRPSCSSSACSRWSSPTSSIEP